MYVRSRAVSKEQPMPKYLALFSYTDTAMAAISAAVSSTGAIRSQTHQLFTDDDVHHILETARTARDHFTSPGQ
jgi:uncharacterized protein with GYD domain